VSQTSPEQPLQQILAVLTDRHRFVLASHARPDGDSIGSQLALAFALRRLGKEVRTVCHDPAPPYLRTFPGINDLEVTERVDESFDAAVVLECGSVDRTEVGGLDRAFLINIDHHVGNTLYGTVNWIDESAAACGEMVFDVVRGLGVPLSKEIATYLYVAILTDTGSFRHANITTRTFDVCRQIADAGVSPADVAARVYQDSSVGKLRLTGALLDHMQMVSGGRVAVLIVDDRILRETGCAADDMEGLINLPLTANDVQAVILFKALDESMYGPWPLRTEGAGIATPQASRCRHRCRRRSRVLSPRSRPRSTPRRPRRRWSASTLSEDRRRGTSTDGRRARRRQTPVSHVPRCGHTCASATGHTSGWTYRDTRSDGNRRPPARCWPSYTTGIVAV
jgi:phosphoesterase RecJ-like protein